MRCPQCGEPVSQFAAGCAVCGADLEAHREQARVRPHVPTPRVSLPYDWWLYLGTALAALFFPLLGLILAFFAARDRTGGERTYFIACGAVSVALLVIPPLRLGVLNLIY